MAKKTPTKPSKKTTKKTAKKARTKKTTTTAATRRKKTTRKKTATDKRVAVMLRLDPHVVDRIETIAEEMGINRQGLMRLMLVMGCESYDLQKRRDDRPLFTATQDELTNIIAEKLEQRIGPLLPKGTRR